MRVVKVVKALVNRISGNANTGSRNITRLVWSFMKFRKPVHCWNFHIARRSLKLGGNI